MNTKLNQLILVVEDSEEDYETLIRAFQKSGVANPVIRCADGDEALDFLYHRGRFADEKRLPGIILLDLNLPGTDGYTVLESIKRDDRLRIIPVIVLTCSSDPNDIDRCYTSGANTYIQKPVSFDGFLEAIRRLKEYWFEIAILP